eukprot:CAMPEP_0117667088 /NCGR_PEP_ID=MMETSP0804-20121206/10759_1 /TAXON_ID=1074897 /ORGANISM="Tetraselmis astigmatica, Strain CCMP880" /LENGTH=339 /DNA_ID=CAMNT_0005474749 /DNA_START=103 /DNA_END=1122 /DNA_ORIENTATION=-
MSAEPQQTVTASVEEDQTDAAARRAKGEFVRGISTARNWITASWEEAKYPAEASRYHLIVGFNCPWCHRVLLARSVLGLEDVVSVDVCFPNRTTESDPRGPNFWQFAPDGVDAPTGRRITFPECTADRVTGKRLAKEIYEMAGIDDQKSVPILFDKKTNTVVNNESAEIMRMFNDALKPLGTRPNIDLFPSDLMDEIEGINAWVYTDINNGSYKAGFSSNQDVYEAAYDKYFKALDRLDEILVGKTFLVGEKLTVADLRLFPTIFRHDPVYYNRFKLNHKFIVDYPNLNNWMKTMYKVPGLAAYADKGYLQHCKQGYYGRTGNGTVPVGPPGYPEVWMQ